MAEEKQKFTPDDLSTGNGGGWIDVGSNDDLLTIMVNKSINI